MSGRYWLAKVVNIKDVHSDPTTPGSDSAGHVCQASTAQGSHADPNVSVGLGQKRDRRPSVAHAALERGARCAAMDHRSGVSALRVENADDAPESPAAAHPPPTRAAHSAAPGANLLRDSLKGCDSACSRSVSSIFASSIARLAKAWIEGSLSALMVRRV